MLSPHEIAALLLLGDAHDIDDLERQLRFVLESPQRTQLIRMRARQYGSDLEADGVEAVQQAVLAERVDVELDDPAVGTANLLAFEIDGDRLFLLGDFTVTHNTALARAFAEDVAFQVGHAYEQATAWYARRPSYLMEAAGV